jgi:Carbohydrate-binding module 64
MKIRYLSLAITVLAVMLATVVGVASARVTAAPICTPATAVSVPFAKDGTGDFCYQATSLCTYINSWNLTTLEVNGNAYTNQYVPAAAIAAVNGTYTIHYVSPVAWGHFEIGAPCSAGNPTRTPTRTATRTNTPNGPTLTPTRTPTRTNTSNGPTLTPTRTPTRTLTPTLTATTPGGSNDQFGIKKLYPSVGREWFNVWNSGSQRNLTWDTYASDPGMVIRGDTNATVYGGSGTRAGQMQVIGDAPRIYIRDSGTESIPPADSVLKWNNVEVTFYAYSTGNSGVGWAGLEAVAKTNHLPDSWDCATRGYGARMLFDGRLDFEKEVSHPNDINVQHSLGNWSGGLPLNRWIGFKYVARNVDNNTHVRLELYRELSIGNVTNPSAPAGGGAWELLGAFTDNGTWSTGFGSCSAQTAWDNGHTDRSLPLTWPNWSVYLRTDGITASIPQYYKWLSVREVAPLP